ncbi:MAG TPA: hypothetical protein VLY24_13315 [Bryobacteraceae bacterium]|nr:hypothetical protein [Bryobacteraceae bacterium]
MKKSLRTKVSALDYDDALLHNVRPGGRQDARNSFIFTIMSGS